MVPSDAILDQDLCAQILKMGHSRVPVHQPGDRKQILGILLVKELLLVKVLYSLLTLNNAKDWQGACRPGKYIPCSPNNSNTEVQYFEPVW